MSKEFKSYDQQMKSLRDNKKIICEDSIHKSILIEYGYFNLINGYKSPFTNQPSSDGQHVYQKNTSIEHLVALKIFDDDLRLLFMRYLSKIEEQLRAITAYKFDQINDSGKIEWFQTTAYNPNASTDQIMSNISKCYSQVQKSRNDYTQHYKDKHKHIPTWIAFKVINFKQFTDLIKLSKVELKDSLCSLYNITDDNGNLNHKLLISMLEYMRMVRNKCAHNERIYDFKEKNKRIKCPELNCIAKSYSKDLDRCCMDLMVYLKYFLSPKDYQTFVNSFNILFKDLESKIPPNAFGKVRASLGIKLLKHLEKLPENSKDIDYNTFDI